MSRDEEVEVIEGLVETRPRWVTWVRGEGVGVGVGEGEGEGEGERWAGSG